MKYINVDGSFYLVDEAPTGSHIRKVLRHRNQRRYGDERLPFILVKLLANGSARIIGGEDATDGHDFETQPATDNA